MKISSYGRTTRYDYDFRVGNEYNAQSSDLTERRDTPFIVVAVMEVGIILNVREIIETRFARMFPIVFGLMSDGRQTHMRIKRRKPSLCPTTWGRTRRTLWHRLPTRVYVGNIIISLCLRLCKTATDSARNNV